MQWHQLDHIQTTCTSLQTDNDTSTSSLNFLQAGYSSWCPTNSVKAQKASLRFTCISTICRNTRVCIQEIHPSGFFCSSPAAWDSFLSDTDDVTDTNAKWPKGIHFDHAYLWLVQSLGCCIVQHHTNTSATTTTALRPLYKSTCCGSSSMFNAPTKSSSS